MPSFIITIGFCPLDVLSAKDEVLLIPLRGLNLWPIPNVPIFLVHPLLSVTPDIVWVQRITRFVNPCWPEHSIPVDVTHFEPLSRLHLPKVLARLRSLNRLRGSSSTLFKHRLSSPHDIRHIQSVPEVMIRWRHINWRDFGQLIPWLKRISTAIAVEFNTLRICSLYVSSSQALRMKQLVPHNVTLWGRFNEGRVYKGTSIDFFWNLLLALRPRDVVSLKRRASTYPKWRLTVF